MTHNVLLAVVGLSPQVVTETLYALHQQNQRLDALHIITTRMGKDLIAAQLLAVPDGKYHEYLREYNIDHAGPYFNFDCIHTIKDANGLEIDDIWTEEHNEALLALCLDLTFQFTSRPDTAVFFSVAGGRKTMSSCLTLAAQLYGRPQDRIFHVLVTPEFESNRDFFYPPKTSRPIILYDAQRQPYVKESKFAAVNLIPVPFVSIRDRLADDLLQQPLDPATLMMSLIRDDDYLLELDLPEGKLRYKGRELDMMPARLSLYALFVLRKHDCRLARGTCRGCTDCYLSLQEIYEAQGKLTALYCGLVHPRDVSEMSDTGILGLTAENFQSYKGKIRQDLARGFGVYSLPELAVDSVGTRPNTRYGLSLDKRRLRVRR